MMAGGNILGVLLGIMAGGNIRGAMSCSPKSYVVESLFSVIVNVPVIAMTLIKFYCVDLFNPTDLLNIV